jgi:hypothetical protein
VLVVDDDRDIAEIAYAVLTDTGFAMSVLTAVRPDPTHGAVGQLEADCVRRGVERQVSGRRQTQLRCLPP